VQAVSSACAQLAVGLSSPRLDVWSLFFSSRFCIITASAPSTAGTHTDGGAVIRKPRSAWLERTPTIHVTFLYVSWYVRVIDTHSILK